MKSHSVWCYIFLCLLIICNTTNAQDTDEDSLPFKIADWLQGPERKDLPWKIKIIKPHLTLQQRNLVQVDARIQAGRLKKRDVERDLHFVLKVADSDNNWVPGYSYTHLPVPAGLESYHQIQNITGLYLRPGKYTLALIIYEANLEQGNIWKKSIEVKDPGDGLLQNLDRDIPKIEFTSGTPDYVMDYDAPPSYLDSIWPLGSGIEWLPVKNMSDVCIDIVMNVSYNQVLRSASALTQSSYRSYGPVSRGVRAQQQRWWNYRMNSSYVMQAGSVLSHLGLDYGCIRISMVDILNMKTIFYRENAEGFDWQNANKVVGSQNRYTVGVDQLSSYTQTSAYFNATMEKILKDDPCATGKDTLPRTVIIVSNQQRFPNNTEIVEITPSNHESTRFYYFCINESPYISGDINKMLKLTKPKRYMIREPRDLRKALSNLILDLTSLQYP